jgi:glycosyltransferase involved in cell wall biosynthesis
MVVIESLACGTPVVAYGMGSVPELIDDGSTGFIVDDLRGAIQAARRIGEIDRARCREVFEQRFSAASMAGRYLDVYEGLIGRTRLLDSELETA